MLGILGGTTGDMSRNRRRTAGHFEAADADRPARVTGMIKDVFPRAQGCRPGPVTGLGVPP
jgi:hypothetical protein